MLTFYFPLIKLLSFPFFTVSSPPILLRRESERAEEWNLAVHQLLNHHRYLENFTKTSAFSYTSFLLPVVLTLRAGYFIMPFTGGLLRACYIALADSCLTSANTQGSRMSLSTIFSRAACVLHYVIKLCAFSLGFVCSLRLYCCCYKLVAPRNSRCLQSISKASVVLHPFPGAHLRAVCHIRKFQDL